MNSQQTQTGKPALTPEEFYSESGGVIGRGKLYEMLRTGRIRSVKVGSHYRIPRSELVDFWNRESEPGAEEE